MSFIDNFKNRYSNGNIVDKLIYINIAVFVLTLLINVLQGLYKGEINWIVEWFSLDDQYSSLLKKPWSIITYGFLHADFLHILMNVIVLHFIGNLFVAFFNIFCNGPLVKTLKPSSSIIIPKSSIAIPAEIVLKFGFK